MIYLMAVMALLQSDTAEDTFKRLEESLVQAKSLRIKYRLDFAQGDQTATATGTLLLKEGNKAKIVMVGAKGNPWAVSDGTKVTVDARQAAVDGATWVTPKDLNVRMATKVARWGILDLPSLPRLIRIYENEPRERLKVSDFAFGQKNGDLETLTYVLRDGNGQADIRLWYHPKSLALKKRSLSVANVNITVTETYEEFTVNGQIPDESFTP
jgi:outer membrane lipoprotein-sorting protein